MVTHRHPGHLPIVGNTHPKDHGAHISGSLHLNHVAAFRLKYPADALVLSVIGFLGEGAGPGGEHIAHNFVPGGGLVSLRHGTQDSGRTQQNCGRRQNGNHRRKQLFCFHFAPSFPAP